MKVLIIDNYDSFTYNLYQFIGEILSSAKAQGEVGEFEINVKRNDEITLQQARDYQADRIIISPGPGSPDDTRYFGVCSDVILELGKTTPLLGVCLGMQGIAHVFGGKVIQARLPVHGKISAVTHNGKGVFEGIPDQLEVMRYHSLIAAPQALPECLQITAFVGEADPEYWKKNTPIPGGTEFEIMAIQHRKYPIQGIQFHPESFATEAGKELIENFLL